MSEIPGKNDGSQDSEYREIVLLTGAVKSEINNLYSAYKNDNWKLVWEHYGSLWTQIQKDSAAGWFNLYIETQMVDRNPPQTYDFEQSEDLFIDWDEAEDIGWSEPQEYSEEDAETRYIRELAANVSRDLGSDFVYLFEEHLNSMTDQESLKELERYYKKLSRVYRQIHQRQPEDKAQEYEQRRQELVVSYMLAELSVKYNQIKPDVAQEEYSDRQVISGLNPELAENEVDLVEKIFNDIRNNYLHTLESLGSQEFDCELDENHPRREKIHLIAELVSIRKRLQDLATDPDVDEKTKRWLMANSFIAFGNQIDPYIQVIIESSDLKI